MTGRRAGASGAPLTVPRSELVHELALLEPIPSPSRASEQVGTPPELACELLYRALARGDLAGRRVADLGCGSGILAIGAARLGAQEVVAIDADPEAVAAARGNSERASVSVRFLVGPVTTCTGAVDTVVMNPPFGAQRRHADRPFWETAYAIARRRIYAFALAASRTFIADSAVARGARVEAIEPVLWRYPRTFPHHRKRSVDLPVDLWVLTPRSSEDERRSDDEPGAPR